MYKDFLGEENLACCHSATASVAVMRFYLAAAPPDSQLARFVFVTAPNAIYDSRPPLNS